MQFKKNPLKKPGAEGKLQQRGLIKMDIPPDMFIIPAMSYSAKHVNHRTAI